MKTDGWIEAWEAASVELVRRIRDEWLADAQAIEDAAGDGQAAQAEPRQALNDGSEDHDVEAKAQGGNDEWTAHGGSSEPARPADGSDGAGDGSIDGQANEGHGSGLRGGLQSREHCALDHLEIHQPGIRDASLLARLGIDSVPLRNGLRLDLAKLGHLAGTTEGLNDVG